jgi:glutathione synthase/RimK-type ligase-like ATP-grasp enzyme
VDVAQFAATEEQTINKGVSGVRTIAKRFSRAWWENLSREIDPPILVQKFIAGFDVRVHCVGIASIALKIESDADDYRYAHRYGKTIEMSAIELPGALKAQCWAHMKAERLEFAAFDFRVCDGQWWLLEVNPMPGFAFFDRQCGGAISRAIWESLKRGYSNLLDCGTHPFIEAERRPEVDQGYTSATARE